MKLSKRLKAVADMVTPGLKIADIGTDHAFLPIWLVLSEKTPSAVAMDINNEPIKKACDNIAKYKLQDRIHCRQSNGLQMLEKDEVDCAVISGMGGDLISNIISSDPDKVYELVVSPHTHQEIVRQTLRQNDYQILSEKLIKDSGKYYPIIKAIKNKNSISINDVPSKQYDYFGELLIREKDPVLKEYLSREYDKYSSIPQKKDYLEIVSLALMEINNYD